MQKRINNIAKFIDHDKSDNVYTLNAMINNVKLKAI